MTQRTLLLSRQVVGGLVVLLGLVHLGATPAVDQTVAFTRLGLITFALVGVATMGAGALLVLMGRGRVPRGVGTGAAAFVVLLGAAFLWEDPTNPFAGMAALLGVAGVAVAAARA